MVGIGDTSITKVQARLIVIERDYLKQNPRLKKILKDKALIAVRTTNNDTQHIPSYATHPDSRVLRTGRWNHEKPSNTIFNNRNEASRITDEELIVEQITSDALRITDETLIAVQATSGGKQRKHSDIRYSDSRVSKKEVRGNLKEPSNTIISNCNEILRTTDNSLLAVQTTDDCAQRIPSDHDSRDSRDATWNLAMKHQSWEGTKNVRIWSH